MQMRRKITQAGLLATILLLVTLATTFAADSGEIEVTEGLDGTPFRTRALAAAADRQGNAVIAWAQQESHAKRIYARRYDSGGTPAQLIEVEGIAFNETPDIAGYVDVAMNDSGNFVVAWTQHFTDGEGYSVHAALYDSNGNLVRAPFQVNTTETDYQWLPSVAIDDAGNFLVAWEQVDGNPFPNGPRDVYGQFYDNAGNRAGSEFMINTTTGGYQHQVDVSMAGNGQAVAVWHSEPGNTDAQDEAIYGQLFNNDGTRYGGEIQISPTSIALQAPVVTMDDSGAFVVAWVGDVGSRTNIYARRFDANGDAASSTFRVNTDTDFAHDWPDIAGDNNGNFAIVWHSDGQDGTGRGIYTRLYDSNGGEFRVNVRTDEHEEFPAVAMSDTDHYAFAWVRSEIQVLSAPSPAGVYARFLDGSPANTAPAVYAGNYASSFNKPNEGEPYTLSAASASDPDGDDLTFSWSLNTDRCEFDDHTLLNPTITCIDDGFFVPTLTVSDGTSTNSSDGSLQVLNVAPDITINGDSAVAVGEIYTLTLGAITDPGDDMVSAITIIWGDGDTDTYSSTGDVTHVYDEPGDFLIRVNLTDEDGSYSSRDSFWLTVTSANSAPVAMDDDYSTDEDTTLNVAAPGILDNDSDADGDPLTAALESDASHGALTLNSDGSFSYLPATDYHGSDSFAYTASDGELTSNVAIVNIDVVPVNDAPSATDDSATTDEDVPVTIDVAANDTDVDGNLDLSRVGITSQPVQGTLTNHGNGTVTYTPSPNVNGADSFGYEICDSGGLCDTAMVTLTVNPVNDPPTVNAGGPYAGDEGSAITLNGSASDVEGDALTYAWSSDGPCEFSDPMALDPTLTCADDGNFTATLTADDGTTANSSSATVNVANVAPTIDLSGAASTDEGANFSLTLGAVNDPGDDTVSELVIDWGDDNIEHYDVGDTPSHVFDDGPASYNISVDLIDEDGTHGNAGVHEVEVYNVAPTIDLIEAPAEPVAIDAQPVPIQVFFSDPGNDTYETTVDWGDGNGDAIGGPSPVSAEHAYVEPGVYTLAVTVTDDDGGSDSTVYEYVVIYYADGGTVTGSGRISDPGDPADNIDWVCNPEICANDEGSAMFAFRSGYHRGATAPTGHTHFAFHAGDLRFVSTSYNWLIVNRGGSNAQFRGEGLINRTAPDDADHYQFMIWAGDETGSKGVDTFRIKIWYEVDGTETVVFDNGVDQVLDKGGILVGTN